MTVTCPGCGRAYGEHRFRHGRTIHCACGSAVAPPAIARADLRSSARPRFLADAMLGRLARWLRLLGFDTAYEPDVRDEDLVRRGLDEHRIILTRDRRLPQQWRVEGIHVLAAETTPQQLREIDAAFELAGRLRPFTRCSRCNAELREAAREDVRGDVPPRVLAAGKAFRRCPRCRRVYWSGSHVERINRAVAAALPGRPRR